MAKRKEEMPKEEKGEEISTARKFKVVYSLGRNGKQYSPGDIVELNLTDEEEVRLVGQSLEEIKEI